MADEWLPVCPYFLITYSQFVCDMPLLCNSMRTVKSCSCFCTVEDERTYLHFFRIYPSQFFQHASMIHFLCVLRFMGARSLQCEANWCEVPIVVFVAATVQRRTATAGSGLGLTEYSSTVFVLEHWEKKKNKRI